jgi:NAD(P)-dependent dehydrogenase (short-subunit alcohol dehydrogenase family)
MSSSAPYALITGAAGGIGQALVSEFRAAGYDVIGTDRIAKPSSLECTHYVEADLEGVVADEAAATTLIGNVTGHTKGRLRVIVNNAAIQVLGGAESLTRNDWERTLKVNLLAPFFLAQAFLAELETNKGCIVNISSIHARLSKRNFVAYATSKAALSALTRTLAVDLEGRVRVNAIEPAAIDTEMLRSGFAGHEDALAQLGSLHPAGRIGSPAEVASCALAISENSLAFLNGACIGLDGAISNRLHDPD